jgi:hypothetical protein
MVPRCHNSKVISDLDIPSCHHDQTLNTHEPERVDGPPSTVSLTLFGSKGRQPEKDLQTSFAPCRNQG